MIACILFIAGIILLASLLKNRSNPSQKNHPQVKTVKTVRCPTCGAQAIVRGRTWDCGYCGDCGNYTSLK